MYGRGVRYPGLPTPKQRIANAKLSGEVSRLTRGALRGLSRAEKLLRVRAVTTDPLVLGHQLGALITPEHEAFAAADAEGAELLRALGADEDHAALVSAWLREDRGVRGSGPR